MIFKIKDAFCGYQRNTDVIKNISCNFESGKVTAVIGPNGCGKSTLLKALARQLSLSSGNISIDDKNIELFKPKELARRIAILPQVRNVPSIPAKALVTHGRFPYMSFPRIPSAADKAIVQKCMRETDTLRYEDVDVSTLSGGQRQRVYIAMLLAQQTDIILMDEPTTFLDMSCQFEILDMIKSLKRQGKCIVVVLHDISHAMQISDDILLLSQGEKVFYGSPEDFIESGAPEKYMNLCPRKAEDDGKKIYYFTKKS